MQPLILRYMCLVCIYSLALGVIRVPLDYYVTTDETHKESVMIAGKGNETLERELKTYHNNAYFATIGIGTPPQKFNVLFDTGSGDLWIPDSTCSKHNCETRHRFCCAKSSSYRKLKKSEGQSEGYNTYRTGKLYGYNGKDVLTIGKMKLKHQVFKAAKNASMPFFHWMGVRIDGIMGLSMLLQDNKVPVPIHMLKSKKIKKGKFSLYMRRFNGTRTKGKDAGEILFGGIDRSKFKGKLTYIPVIDKSGRWIVSLDGIYVGGKELDFCTKEKKCHAVLDSGSNFIFVPNKYIKTLLKKLKIKGTSSSSNFECKSNSDRPNLEFSLGGKKFGMDPREYTKNIPGDKSRCVPAITAADASKGHFISDKAEKNEPPVWVFGDSFLVVYYAVFDFKKRRIGLAPAK